MSEREPGPPTHSFPRVISSPRAGGKRIWGAKAVLAESPTRLPGCRWIKGWYSPALLCRLFFCFWHHFSFLIAFHGFWVEFTVLLDHVPPGEAAGDHRPGAAWLATGGFLSCRWEEVGQAGVQSRRQCLPESRDLCLPQTPCCCDLSDILNWTWEPSQIFQRL